jgi:hypothetical protein
MPKIKYQDINLSQKSLALIATCNKIIADYTAQGYILTLRQLYYQLVSRDVIPNKQSEYKRVGSVVNDGRLAGLIDWSMLEDRTRNVKSISHWDSPEEIVAAVAQQYAIDKWSTQDVRPEVWIEKDALVGVIERTCRDIDVSYFSCRGYTSQSEMWGAAQRFIKHARNGQKTHVIHLGDHDPSGIDMSRDIETRIRLFMIHHLGAKAVNLFEFSRIALNMDQVQQYQPPPNPAKSTDSRFQGYMDEHGDESWELDALEPQVLDALIRDKVAEIRDDETYEERKEQEDREKAQLATVSDHWDDVINFLGTDKEEDE